MNKMYAALLGLAALALIVPAQATEICYTTSPATATIPDVNGVLGGDIYVDNDFCELTTCVGGFSIWIYQETNGIAGQQRADEVVNDVVNCTDGTVGDTDIF